MNEINSASKTTPKDFFLNLGVIVSLYVSTVSLLALLFAIINHYLPDALNYGYYRGEIQTMRWSISSLIIVFPLYILFSHLVNKDIAIAPEKRNIWIKKWSTFLTLFLTGATIVVDLIFLINTFLGGEINSRFFYKVLAVLLVTAAVFFYYLYDLRKETGGSDSKTKIIAVIVSLLVLTAIIIGFVSVGSPVSERDRKLDQRRVQDLVSIQSRIVNAYWPKLGKVPASLDELSDPLASFKVPTDPESKLPYEYQMTGSNSFQLCATFNSSTPADDRSSEDMYMYYDEGANMGSFKHGEGRVCFERTINPTLYPVEDRPSGVTKPVVQ